MPINLIECEAVNCTTGLTLPQDGNINVHKFTAINAQVGIEVRNAPQSVLQTLGLPADTPVPDLIEALRVLKGAGGLPPEQQAEKLRGTKLAETVLSMGGNLTTIVTAFLPLLDKIKV